MHGDDGTCADAHSSAASHALNVGLGNDAPAQRVAALQARLAGLANEKAGVDLTTAGLVLQVADHRRASGASIDTSAVEKTLGKVVKRLEAMGLSEAGRGYYDGTRHTEKLVDAMEDLKSSTNDLVQRMGGNDSVLQGIADTHVRDRLLKKISEGYPEAFDKKGNWQGLTDDKGHVLAPVDFLNKKAADTLQQMSDVMDSAQPFEQLQGKAQELLKIVDMVRQRVDEPASPPESADMTPPPHNPGPPAGSNWNQNSAEGGKVGDITINPPTAHSIAGNDQVALKAIDELGKANKRLFDALVMIRNLSASREPTRDRVDSENDSGIEDEDQKIDDLYKELTKDLGRLRSDGSPSSENKFKSTDGDAELDTKLPPPPSWMLRAGPATGNNPGSPNEPGEPRKKKSVSFDPRPPQTHLYSRNEDRDKDLSKVNGSKGANVSPARPAAATGAWVEVGKGKWSQPTPQGKLVATDGPNTSMFDRQLALSSATRSLNKSANGSNLILQKERMGTAPRTPGSPIEASRPFVGTAGPGQDLFGKTSMTPSKYVSGAEGYEEYSRGRWTRAERGRLTATTGLGTNPMNSLKVKNIHPQFNGSAGTPKAPAFATTPSLFSPVSPAVSPANLPEATPSTSPALVAKGAEEIVAQGQV
jgi:hypothetical protein